MITHLPKDPQATTVVRSLQGITITSANGVLAAKAT
jgi:hypothetical protein